MNKFIKLTYVSKDHAWMSDTFYLNSANIITMCTSVEVRATRIEMSDGHQISVTETAEEIMELLDKPKHTINLDDYVPSEEP